MAIAQKGSDKIAAPGRHLLQLVNVEEDRITSKYSDAPDGKAPVWYWNFLSNKKDEFGTPEKIRKMTSADLTPNNNQAKFWKLLVPGWNYESATGDTSEVEGRWFDAEIVHTVRGDSTYADIAFIKPYTRPVGTAAPAPKPVKPAPEPAEEEDAPLPEDPWADDAEEAVAA